MKTRCRQGRLSAALLVAALATSPAGAAEPSAAGAAGWPDLFVVRGRLGSSLLFRNLGDGGFEEVGAAWGLALEGDLGSGPTFADFDGDDRLDLVIGGVGGTPPRLFRNTGSFFEETTATSGVVSVRDTFSSAFGDYDRDGDLDLFVAQNGGPPLLYRNDLPPGNHSLTLQLLGSGGNREAIGARVLVTAGGRRQLRELRAGSSYLSQDPARVHVGLGAATRADEVEIRWPDGTVEHHYELAGDREHVLVEGSVVAVPALGRAGLAAFAGFLLVAACHRLRRCKGVECRRSS